MLTEVKKSTEKIKTKATWNTCNILIDLFFVNFSCCFIKSYCDIQQTGQKVCWLTTFFKVFLYFLTWLLSYFIINRHANCIDVFHDLSAPIWIFLKECCGVAQTESIQNPKFDRGLLIWCHLLPYWISLFKTCFFERANQ